jgi:peptidoglycan/xylan/chitin deacetylase (PgdA/CDA1 family)
MALQHIPILMYHNVAHPSATNRRTFTVSPDKFEAQLRYLHDHQFTTLTIAQLANFLPSRRALPTKPVVLTFDDGYADFYESAFPILKRYDATASVYVVSNWVQLCASPQNNTKMMSWSQLRQLHAEGIEIGAHTHNHVKLDSIAHHQARWEIAHSKQCIEQHLGLGAQVFTFAYPFGRYTSAVSQAVIECGFRAACAVRYDMSSLADKPYELARIIVQGNHTLDDFKALLTPEGVRGKLALHRVRAQLWRIALKMTSPLRLSKPFLANARL